MTFDLQEIIQITGGRLRSDSSEKTIFGISTDSRTVGKGELFIPLRGDNFDGHEFLALAVRSGAAACLSEDEVQGLPVPVIIVEDCLKALGDLAAAVRRNFSGPLVGITGTSGKTTTKEMLAGILSQQTPGLVTKGNFNNLIGLPLTLFTLSAEHRWSVLEMGMSARGEISRLCEIAAPTIGMITNVGPAHLETLHGLEGVARAKGELFAALAPGSTALINADDRHVRKIPVANSVRRLMYGFAPEADIRAGLVAATEHGQRFQLYLPDGEWCVKLGVVGRHNVSNALAAAAAAHVMGSDGVGIVRGLEAFSACRGRMELISLDGNVLLLEDSYNANPLSVGAALATLNEQAASGQRIAILGDMLELGEETARWHRETGILAADKTDILILVGDLSREIAAGAASAGMAATAIYPVASHEAAIKTVRTLVRPGARILVKGSRGMRMEVVSGALKEMKFTQSA
ncbi:MAG: UDP-N-acetylmuramoyl-tripeptide--D-alanyl-D-alanine ligase [Desulfuromonadales bacterium]|nr:UDP-N-acetylmuramoyl-tripeptide--D-alanyl-D-alanine ligase [Desulfuromonadales bacterium]